MRARWTTACLAGLALGAACSGSGGTAASSGGSGSSTAPSAQAPVTTTTTPPPLSHEQAAERYLAIGPAADMIRSLLGLGAYDEDDYS